VILVPRKLSDFEKEIINNLKEAALFLSKNTTKSYSIGTRSLTYKDLPEILNEIAKLEGKKTPRFMRAVPVDR
jgi:hypothetical protein